MKSLILSLFLLATIGATSQTTNQTNEPKGAVNWMSWDEMVAAMEKEPKPIFIDTYTSWCGWCKTMDKNTFSNAKIANYMNEHYYAVKMNAEMKDSILFRDHLFINPKPTAKRSTHQLAASLLENKLSYPSFVFLNSEFVRLKILPGYKSPKDFEPFIRYYAEGVNEGLSYQEFLAEWNSESKP